MGAVTGRGSEKAETPGLGIVLASIKTGYLSGGARYRWVKLTCHYHLVNHIFDTPGTWDGWPVNIPTRNILSSPQDAAAARLVVNHSMVSFRPSRKEVFARQPNSRAALEVSSERRG